MELRLARSGAGVKRRVARLHLLQERQQRSPFQAVLWHGAMWMTEKTNLGGSFTFKGGRTVRRMGFGAMQLAGPGVYGPPKDPEEVARVLRAAVEAGVDHIDTSDFYGPHVVNELIRETLAPYPENLVLVTKVGARRTPDKGWHPAQSPAELRSGVEDNLRRLDVEALEIVNLRLFSHGRPEEGPLAERFEAMLEMQREGKIKHIGLSNVTVTQLEEAVGLGEVVCVQNSYGVLAREDDALVETCAARGIAFVPFFPLGGFTPFQGQVLDAVAAEAEASVQQVALAWLLQHAPNILLIPGTSKVAHLQDNLKAAEIVLTEDQVRQLDGIATAA